MTQFLGFDKYGEEYKVMGLAPYGNPIYVNEISKLFLSDFELNLKFFNHDKKKIIIINLKAPLFKRHY